MVSIILQYNHVVLYDTCFSNSIKESQYKDKLRFKISNKVYFSKSKKKRKGNKKKHIEYNDIVK